MKNLFTAILLLLFFSITIINAQALTTPADAAVGIDLNAAVTFDWADYTFENDATNEDDYYIVKIGTSASASDVYSTTSSTLIVSTEDINLTLASNNTLYYWEVEAWDDGALVYTYTGFTFTTEYVTPVLSSPVDVAKDVNIAYDILFTWSASTGASNYQIQIADNSSFTTPIVDELVTSATEVSSSALTFGTALDYYTTYYWRVKAADADPITVTDNSSDWTTGWSFKTIDDYTPLSPFPADNATDITNSSIQFIWQLLNRTEFATFQSPTFKLVYDTDAAFSTAPVVLTSGFISTVSTGMRFLGLEPGTEYFWKVITVKPSNEGENYQTHITSGALVVGQTYKVVVDDASNLADFSNIGGPGPGVALNDEFTATSTGIPTNYDSAELIVAGDAATSATWSFTTSGAVAQPTIAYPKDETTVYSPVPIFYWYTMGFNVVHKYEIEWSTTLGNLSNNTVDVGASAIVLSSTEGWKNDLQGLFGYPTPALEGGQHFYWHVRSYIDGDPTNHSDWSDVADFYTFDAVNAAIPVPAYPTGGVEVYSKFPVLYWTLSGPSQGLTFNVRYGTDLDVNFDVDPLGTIYEEINNVAQLFATIYQGVVGGTTYYWQVQSDNGTTTSAWSDYAEFSVYDFTADLKPILSWPIGGNTVYSTDVNFAWHVEGPSLGLSYVLRYAETVGDLNLAGAVTGTGVETTSSSNLMTVTLASGTDYVWAVRVNNTENASNWSDIETFSVISGNGSTIPVLNWPVGGATVWATSQDLSWTLVGGGSPTFEVEVYTDAALTTYFNGSSYTGVTDSPLNLTGLTAGETYYWRVRVEPAEPWSNVEVFTVFAGVNPASPLAGSPAGGVELNKSTATLSWFSPTYLDHAVKHEVEIANNKSMSNSTVVGDLTNPSTEVSGLAAGDYYWRSRTMNEDGTYSDYSDIANFKVTGTTGVENEEGVPQSYELSQNYPNPFNPSTLIKFSLPEANYVTLKIYNMLGQEIKTLVSKQANAGVYTVNWNGSDNFGHKVSSGAYIYQIVSGNFVQTRKMILLK